MWSINACVFLAAVLQRLKFSDDVAAFSPYAPSQRPTPSPRSMLRVKKKPTEDSYSPGLSQANSWTDDDLKDHATPVLQLDLGTVLSRAPDRDVDLLRQVWQALESAEGSNAVDEKSQFSSCPVDPAELSQKVRPHAVFVNGYGDRDVGRRHDGRFALFGPTGVGGSENPVSLHPDVVFSLDDPLSFVADALSCGEGRTSVSSTPRREAVVFMPCSAGPYGSSGEASGTGGVEYYSRVLGDLPMAQVYSGGCSEDLDITLPSYTMWRLRKRGWIGSAYSEKEGNTLRVRAQDRTHLRWAANPHQGRSRGARATLRKLLNVAVAGDNHDGIESDSSSSPHLVLVVHSGAALEAAAALHDWKFCASKTMPLAEVEAKLRHSVTVVTVASLCRSFPDGPAYVHVSMLDDPLVHIKAEGDGAVRLNALSPYYNSDDDGDVGEQYRDAHNMDACLVQFLSIVMRVNGLISFRSLYENGGRVHAPDIDPTLYALTYSETDIDLPPNLDLELLPAMIRATGGHQRLWHPEESLGVDKDEDSPLPDEYMAEAIVECQYGYGSYKEIADALK